jgi:hypothetical protein
MKSPFWWKQLTGCTVQCEVDLERLFETDKQRDAFETKWPEFLASDSYNQRVYQKTGKFLTYRSEQLIPKRKRGKGEQKDRKPLLLVFGNPATHSVDGGMFFSFDEGRGEHRFWTRILKPAGVLNMPAYDDGLPATECNKLRREELFGLKYQSDFRIGMSVIVSMPSAASEKTWSGVAGVQRLLGTAAMRRLEEAETKRVLMGAKCFFANFSGSRIGAGVTRQEDRNTETERQEAITKNKEV